MSARRILRAFDRQPAGRFEIDQRVLPGRSQVFLPSLGYSGVLYGGSGGSPIVTLQNANAPFTQAKVLGGIAHVFRPNTSTISGESYKWQTPNFDIGANGSMFWYGYLDTLVGTGFESVLEYGGSSWGLLLECTGSNVKASYVDSPTSAAFTATLSASVAINVPIAVGLIKSGTTVTVVCRGSSASTSGGNGGIRRSAGSGFGFEYNPGYAGTFLAGVTSEALSVSAMQALLDNPWSVFRANSRTYFIPAAGGGGATLTVQDLTQGQSLGVPSLTEHNVLAANALSQAQSLEAPSLTQHGLLAVDALAHSHTLGEPGLTQAHVLVAQDVAQTHTLGEPSLTQAHVLIVQAIGQDQSLGEPALTQHNVLVVDALGQSQVFGTPSLTAAGVLAVDALAQAQSFGLPALVQHHVLAVDALAQTQAFGSPSLTQAHILTPDALAQAQTTGNVSFTIAASLAVQAIVQAQAFGSPDLTQHHVLTPDAIVQAQQLAEAALTQHGALSVDGMTQDQALDALALTQHYALIVDALLQGHEISEPGTGASYALIVEGIAQAQSLEIPGLTQHAVLAVDGLTQAQILGLVGIGGAIIGIDGGTIVCFQRLGGRIVASRLGPSIVAATLH